MKAILNEDQTIHIYPENVAELVVIKMMNEDGRSCEYIELMEEIMGATSSSHGKSEI